MENIYFNKTSLSRKILQNNEDILNYRKIANEKGKILLNRQSFEQLRINFLS